METVLEEFHSNFPLSPSSSKSHLGHGQEPSSSPSPPSGHPGLQTSPQMARRSPSLINRAPISGLGVGTKLQQLLRLPPLPVANQRVSSTAFGANCSVVSCATTNLSVTTGRGGPGAPTTKESERFGEPFKVEFDAESLRAVPPGRPQLSPLNAISLSTSSSHQSHIPIVPCPRASSIGGNSQQHMLKLEHRAQQHLQELPQLVALRSLRSSPLVVVASEQKRELDESLTTRRPCELVDVTELCLATDHTSRASTASTANSDLPAFTAVAAVHLNKDSVSWRHSDKRKRERMNNSLVDLGKLIPYAYSQKLRGKVEKTEIIELAVKYLKHLQLGSRNRNNGSPADGGWRRFMTLNDEERLREYKKGYRDCVAEAVKYLTEGDGAEGVQQDNGVQSGPNVLNAGDAFCVRLVNHLLAALEKMQSDEVVDLTKEPESGPCDNGLAAGPGKGSERSVATARSVGSMNCSMMKNEAEGGPRQQPDSATNGLAKSSEIKSNARLVLLVREVATQTEPGGGQALREVAPLKSSPSSSSVSALAMIGHGCNFSRGSVPVPVIRPMEVIEELIHGAFAGAPMPRTIFPQASRTSFRHVHSSERTVQGGESGQNHRQRPLVVRSGASEHGSVLQKQLLQRPLSASEAPSSSSSSDYVQCVVGEKRAATSSPAELAANVLESNSSNADVFSFKKRISARYRAEDEPEPVGGPLGPLEHLPQASSGSSSTTTSSSPAGNLIVLDRRSCCGALNGGHHHQAQPKQQTFNFSNLQMSLQNNNNVHGHHHHHHGESNRKVAECPPLQPIRPKVVQTLRCPPVVDISNDSSNSLLKMQLLHPSKTGAPPPPPPPYRDERGPGYPPGGQGQTAAPEVGVMQPRKRSSVYSGDKDILGFGLHPSGNYYIPISVPEAAFDINYNGNRINAINLYPVNIMVDFNKNYALK